MADNNSPLEEQLPIDNPEDVEEAIEFALEALEAAEKLESSALDSETVDPLSNRLLNVAIENYIERFNIPRAAHEANDLVLYSGGGDDNNKGEEKASPKASSSNTDDDDEDKAPEASRLKKVILYLYAIVERIFKAIFDLFRSQKATARKLMPLTKQFIGESDGLSASVASQLTVKDRSLMVALQIDGIAPTKVPELFDTMADNFEKQHSHTAVQEVIRLVAAVRDKNQDRITAEAEKLRVALENGLKATLESVDPQKLPVFNNEKKSSNVQYYASEPLFGQNYIAGTIANGVNASGTFRFSCGVRRDAEVPLRAPSFPVLTPDEIRHICRTSLRVCENIIRFSRDEDLLQKVLREASFLKSKETNQATVVALRIIAAVGQNSYIVHLRFVTRTMQALMRWCGASIRRYEGLKENG